MNKFNENQLYLAPATGEYLNRIIELFGIARKIYLIHLPFGYILEFEEKDKYFRQRTIYYIEHRRHKPENKLINFLTFFRVYRISKIWRKRK